MEGGEEREGRTEDERELSWKWQLNEGGTIKG